MIMKNQRRFYLHRIILALTQDENKSLAYDSAIEFCNDLTDGHTEHDYYNPLKTSDRKYDTLFAKKKTFDISDETVYKNGQTVFGELSRLINVGKQESLSWIKKADEALHDENNSFYDYYLYLKLATGLSTFHVFDATGWSSGGPVTDIDYFNKIVTYMTKEYKNPIYVSGFDVHY